MDAPRVNVEEVFHQAVEKDPAERLAFLQATCADSKVRTRVEALLKAHDSAGSFLDGPAVQLVPLAGTTDSHAVQSDPPSVQEPLDFLDRCDTQDRLGLLAHYEIVGIVGRGGMGTVLRGVDVKLNRVVAIKVMAPQLAANAMARQRFQREAQVAAAVRHDHVVTIHAVDEWKRLPYLVMEYISGPSLQQKIDAAGALPSAQIFRIGTQIASGLAAAHAQGLVHRDIKPANILLENGIERVKITDFGLARSIDDVRITQAGAVYGTPQYMSPEQAQGERVDQRSDLFSLGSVLYAMCTGRPPFRGETGIAVLRRVCDDTPRPIREVNPDIPAALDEIVNKLLAKKPEARFQSAGDVAELLSRYLAHRHFQGEGPTQPNAIRANRGENSGGAKQRGAHSTTQLLLAPEASAASNRRKALVVAAGTVLAGLALTLVLWPTPRGTVRVESDDPAVAVPPPPPARAPFDAQQARDDQTAWANYLGAQVETTNSLGMKFRLIPPGEFTMGTTDADEEAWTKYRPYAGHRKLAAPPHQVRLSRPFYLAEREVRYGDFLDLLKREPGNQPKHPDHELEGVLLGNCTWFDCIEFCNRLSEREGLTPAYTVAGQAVTVTPGATGYRLPTEAEWEFACRAGTTSLWYFGWTAREAQARADRNLQEAEAYLRVRLGDPNPFGLHGMYAGAAEWCWDWYAPGYYRDCDDRGVVVDPWGPDAGQARITRGGTSYAHAGGDLSLINSATRDPQDPIKPLGVNGFGRVVLPIPAGSQASHKD